MVANAGVVRAVTRMCPLVALLAAVSSVGSAQIFPTSPEAAAKVIELTGDVTVLRDSGPWVLSLGDQVQVKQVIRTGPDGYAKLQVSDGSTFEVYPSSTVTFRQNPTNWRDLLDIWVGKIKIHIQKMGGQPNPNTIHTPSAIISVRGTTFDVSVDGDEENTTVTVEEGVVSVRHATRGGVERTVREGETIEVLKSQPLAHSIIDKGAIFQRVLRAMADALQTLN
ncbi:MAG TPA: FecR family protein, partial [Chloroflexota bacterium]|nr:FecR family protein [Chloroflexota bacterium]